MKVYVVVFVDFDYWNVEGVFDTEALASAYISTMEPERNGLKGRIFEHELQSVEVPS